ncbi:MAG: triose-phosphate isomerase [Candidatus Melainabacteria bacterium]|nr:triose-phosphate isomerase [Candidatus Melainabacteria bacterium]
MKRKKIIIGNWKMNLSLPLAQDLILKLKSESEKKWDVDIAVCPPYIYLAQVLNILKGSKITVGAQNMYYKEEGAFTGEISPLMLKDIGIQMVIIGHSERRQIFKETDSEINLKVKAALQHDFTPVLCIGEDLGTREKGKAEEYVTQQVTNGIKDISKNDIEKIIFAYEPIWAIGTGKICSGEDAVKVNKAIRNILKEKYSTEISNKIRILYGGSIKSANFGEHISNEDIDGGLVGGASLKAEEFAKIIDLADKAMVTI